jgi:quinoprotein glucose dehydrogenase
MTAYNMSTGTIAWQVPLGDGPRNHPLLKGLNLGPLGGARGYPLLTSTLLFVGHRGRAAAANGGVPEPTTLQALDKATGQVIVKIPLPYGPVSSPMTYMHNGRQHIVMAIGTGQTAELVAYALPQ